MLRSLISKLKTEFAEFWPFYLQQHANRTCRGLHYFGTTVGLFFLILFAFSWEPGYFVAMLVGAYFFAWIGHFFFEKNRPATFKYPFWSFFCDCLLYVLWLTGGARRELEKAEAKPHFRDPFQAVV